MRELIVTSDYYKNYISKVLGNDLNIELKLQKARYVQFLNDIPQEKAQFAYENDKWTVLQVLQHVIDTERIMSYRALRIARNDQTTLPGFEQDDYANEDGSADKSILSVVNELVAVRSATIEQFKNFNQTQLGRVGTASDQQVSVAGLGFIMVGHAIHHQTILQERYL